MTYHEQRSRSFSFNSSGQRSIGCPSLASSSQVSSFLSEDDESFEFHLHNSTAGADDYCNFEEEYDQRETAEESTFQAQMAEEKTREMEFILHQQLSSTAAATSPRPVQEEDTTPFFEWESFDSSYDGHSSLMNLVVTTKDQEDDQFGRPLSPMTTLDEYDSEEDDQRKLIVKQQITQIRSCLEQTRQMQYQLLQTLAMTTYYYSEDEEDEEEDMHPSRFTTPELPETQSTIDSQFSDSIHLNSSRSNNNLTRYRRRRRYRHSSPTSNKYFPVNLLWFGFVVMAFLLGMMTNTDTHIVFKSKVITPIQRYFPQQRISYPQQSMNQQCASTYSRE